MAAAARFCWAAWAPCLCPHGDSHSTRLNVSAKVGEARFRPPFGSGLSVLTRGTVPGTRLLRESCWQLSQALQSWIFSLEQFQQHRNPGLVFQGERLSLPSGLPVDLGSGGPTIKHFILSWWAQSWRPPPPPLHLKQVGVLRKWSRRQKALVLPGQMSMCTSSLSFSVEAWQDWPAGAHWVWGKYPHSLLSSV